MGSPKKGPLKFYLNGVSSLWRVDGRTRKVLAPFAVESILGRAMVSRDRRNIAL